MVRIVARPLRMPGTRTRKSSGVNGASFMVLPVGAADAGRGASIMLPCAATRRPLA